MIWAKWARDNSGTGSVDLVSHGPCPAASFPNCLPPHLAQRSPLHRTVYKATNQSWAATVEHLEDSESRLHWFFLSCFRIMTLHLIFGMTTSGIEIGQAMRPNPLGIRTLGHYFLHFIIYHLSNHSDPLPLLSSHYPKGMSWSYWSIYHLQVTQNQSWMSHQL